MQKALGIIVENFVVKYQGSSDKLQFLSGDVFQAHPVQ